MRKLVLGVLASAAVVLAAAPPAGAATTIGQTFTPSGGCPINDITAFQTGSPNATNEYVSPSAGVIPRGASKRPRARRPR